MPGRAGPRTPPRAHLELALDADQLPGTRWQLDEQAVREILAQLLDNARRHAASRIALTVAASGDAVHLRIGDDGPGIPDGVVGRAFGRFTSFDALGGAGLGLAIASDLARLHGGDLAYENRLFVLRLPAQPISGTEPA